MKTNKLLNPLSLFFVGLFLGALSRLFDMYYPNLGEIFSQMSVWILLGTLIAIYSPTKKSRNAEHPSVLHRDVAHLLCNSHAYPRCLRLDVCYRLDDIRLSVAGHGVFRMDDKRVGIDFLKSLALESYLFRFCPVFCSLTVCAFMILPLMVC